MCTGMHQFQQTASLRGLPALERPERLLLLRRRRRRADADGAVLRLFPAIAPAAQRAARAGRVVRPGPADDQHPEGRLGGSQPRRLLAAAGSVHPPRRRAGAAARPARRTRVSMPACASWSESRTRTCAMRLPSLVDSPQRDGYSPLLPVGDRACRADAARIRARPVSPPARR